jgi:DNA polymerase-3 subunit gamma/tau
LNSSLPAPATPVTRPAAQPVQRPIVSAPAPKPVPKVKETPAPQPTAKTTTEPQELRQSAPVDENLWPQVLGALKKSHNTLYGIARMAKPTFYEDTVELGLTFAFHKKRLSENKNKEIIIAVIKDLTGKEYGLKCTLLEKGETITPVAAVTTPAAASPDFAAINSIFGGAEVLES